MPTVTYKIASGPDDGSFIDNAPSNMGILTELGRLLRTMVQYDAYAWLRFTAVDIPQGAKITSAILRLVSGQNLSDRTVNGSIQAEPSPNATNPGYDYLNRPRTVSKVLWHDIPPWVENEAIVSPDIAEVIQEVINLPDWGTTGNILLLFLQEDGSSTTKEEATLIRRFWTYNHDPTLAAELEITYGEPVPQHNLTISATVGGTTNPPPETYLYDEGVSVVVTAIPVIGYSFSHWELDGVNVSSDLNYSVLMNADHTLHAVFVEELPPTKGMLEVHAYEV